MKKRLIAATLLIVLLGASIAFAATNDRTEAPVMPIGQMVNFEQMQDYHKQMIDQAIKAGRITAEQAKVMDEHMNGMQNMMKNMGPGMMNGMMGQGMTGPKGVAVCPGVQQQANQPQK